jgi:translation initiation factor 1A
MVKNTTGGNKSKGQARKFTTAKPSNTLRTSLNEFELYGQVTKILGGGMCNVICIDNITRLCHIRGKFKTRGKRDNFINNGTWVLVGLREWASSSSSKDKLEQCDLLEVYNDHEKDKLKSTITNINWSIFISNDSKFNLSDMSKDKDNNDIIFADEKEQEYMEIISKQIEIKTSKNTKTIFFEEDEINFEDI